MSVNTLYVTSRSSIILHLPLGVLYAMNATVDSDLANLIQQHVNSLKDDVNKLVFDREEEVEAKKKMERALENILINVKELDEQVANVDSKVDENRRQMNEMKAKQDMTKISCGNYFIIISLL